jgi:hypothetical protein
MMELLVLTKPVIINFYNTEITIFRFWTIGIADLMLKKRETTELCV